MLTVKQSKNPKSAADSRQGQSGSALSFVIVMTFILIVLGATTIYLCMHMGGSRELLHATDAGSLNVAKQAIKKPGVSLVHADEKENFEGLMNGDKINLSNFNRIFGQTLLVALNAQAERTAAASSNADTLIDMVHGHGGIADRLRTALKDSEIMADNFNALSLVSSVRMLGSSASAIADIGKNEVAYMEEGTASNLDFSNKTLPLTEEMTQIGLPDGLLSTQNEKTKLSFIAGYRPVKLEGLGKHLSAVPALPGQAPHLVSQKDFNNKRAQPHETTIVPPNAFKSGGAAASSRGVSCSIIGALGTTFTASIPRGYIIVKNAPGVSFSGMLGGNDHIFAQELNTGIFVGPGEGANRAFTTDSRLYQDWLAYNTAAAQGQTPLPPRPSAQGIMGNPLTITAPAEMIDWTSFAAPNPIAIQMVPAFVAAYHHANGKTPFASNGLTAIEKWKALVIQGFGEMADSNGNRQFIPPPTEITGMKAYEYSGTYTSPDGPIDFGKEGSIQEFLHLCDASKVLQHITQRLHQIKPEAGDNEIKAVLNKACIGMGSTFYIYRDDKDKLTISDEKPSWANYSTPDGRPMKVLRTQNINRRLINSPGDGGAPAIPFGSAPSRCYSHENCVYTPSSGYRNLLGVLDFSVCTTIAGDGSKPGEYLAPPWFAVGN